MDFQSAFSSALLLILLLPLSVDASSKLYVVYMGEKKHDDPLVVTASHYDVLTSVLGSKDEALKSIVYSYKHGFSGFAAMLTESQAETLASFPGILNVNTNTYDEIHTTRSWDFLGLDYYQPPQLPGLLQKAKYGEDIIVGVVDTGIWPESRSFDDNGYGPVPARWNGACQPGEAFNTTSCNRKIIGARWYADGVNADLLKGQYMSARDHVGHGTHTASTIAGGQVWNASYGGLGGGVARGGAPRARLAIYKACWAKICPAAAVLAAIDDAIHDGVDVLSLSLGFRQHLATLHAVQRGISVVFSTGNDGPVMQTVVNAVPWVLTVAASTIDRSFPTLLSLGNGQKLLGQSLYFNVSANSGKFNGLVDGLSCGPETLASINVTGMVLLCSGPTKAAAMPPWVQLPTIIQDVIKLGAKGLIFAQYSVNILAYLNPCNGIMPCVLVDYEIGYRISSYARSTRVPLVKVSPSIDVVGNRVLSPRVAMFSSRGPGVAFPAILKPDIAAPGVSILAAMGNSYKFDSGTSMACPHVSAVVALLKSVHPSWSPSMIKSAIITTASVTDRFGMPIQAEGPTRKLADPFDFGGGHINPAGAMDPGLVYDMDAREYFKFFNCTFGSSRGCESLMDKQCQINLPSIAVPNLKESVTILRTVTNVGEEDVTYQSAVEAPTGVAVSVEPSVITFTKGGSRSATFKVNFTRKQQVQGGYTFGSLTWFDRRTHSVRIPIAIRILIQDFEADAS